MSFIEYIAHAFTVNLADYENLGSDLYINIFLFVLTAAICICFYIFNYYKKNMYLIANQLLRHKCIGKDNAKTLGAIGLDGCFFVKRMLGGSGHITKVVRRTDEVVYTYEEQVAMNKARRKTRRLKVEPETTLFYIDESKADRARHIAENYNIGGARTTLLVVMLVIVYFVIMCAMPEILSLINAAVGAVVG